MQRIIGIDLGTTYSCISIFNEKKGQFEILPNRNGNQTTPSVVGLTKKNEIIVGEKAKRQLATRTEHTVAEIKRHMGELTSDGRPYRTRLGDSEYSPEEISAYVLRELKEAAETFLGQSVKAAVITVPAYFEEPQRQATMRAGKMAGLDVKRIINEPTAAAIAYGYAAESDDEDDEDDVDATPVRLVIYDLGGGTFDVSVIEVSRGKIRVLATHGNHYLGGVDFDRAITDWIVREIHKRHDVDLERIAAEPGRRGVNGRRALARIRTEAEDFKKNLSAQQVVSVDFAMLPVSDPTTDEPLDVELEVARTEFEQMIMPKLEETLACVDRALKDAKLSIDDIDDLILVGGSTRIPVVQRRLSERFGKKPKTDIHPDLCVALGAAHEAVKHVDTSVVDDDPSKQAAMAAIADVVADMPAVVDVTGHSLGVAVLNPHTQSIEMSTLIQRQSPIPIMANNTYTPSSDYQTHANICVFQGESRLAHDNTSLGEFMLKLPQRPASEVTITVEFSLDVNAVLNVSARDELTGEAAEIEIRDERLRGQSANTLLPSSNSSNGASTPTDSALPAKVQGDSRTVGGCDPVEVPVRFRVFVAQAREILPGLGQEQQGKLETALAALYRAAAVNDEQAVEQAGNHFMDILFEVRP